MSGGRNRLRQAARCWPTAVAVAAVVLTTGCGAAAEHDGSDQSRPGSNGLTAAQERAGPAGDAFYQPPAALPAGHGALVWQRAYAGPAAIPGATNTLVLYTQQGVDGRPVATSGIVAVPPGQPPAGGWPVITWGHGTVGIADTCAPSRAGSQAADDVNKPLLARWVAAGYAVVQTDYEGLGTPGPHPYLDGRSEGRAQLDIVRAARSVNAGVGTRVVVAGHSQGGHAALWAASLAPAYTPELTVAGTLAFAPATHLADLLGMLRGVTITGRAGTILLVLRGADVSAPALGVRKVLSTAARGFWPDTLTACTGALNSPVLAGALPLGGVLDPAADLGALRAQLARNDPSALRIPGPVLIEQGLSDLTVLPQFTEQAAASLGGAGDQVVLHRYGGATHATVMSASAADATAFLAQRLPAVG